MENFELNKMYEKINGLLDKKELSYGEFMFLCRIHDAFKKRIKKELDK